MAIMRPVLVSPSDLERDPYATYDHIQMSGGVGFVPRMQLYLVTRWADVMGLRDERYFTADVNDSPLRRTIGPNMLHADGAEHHRLRQAVAPLLRPGPLRGWIERTVPPIAAELLEPIVGEKGGDLLLEYAEPLSVRSVADLLGVGDQPLSRLRDWFQGIGAGAANFRADPAVHSLGSAASADVDTVVLPYLRGGMQPRAGSLLDLLVKDKGALTEQEMLGTVKLMIIGGMQEPRDLIGSALTALLLDEDLQQRVRRNPNLVPRLLEEALRWNSPVGTITRRALCDVDIAGVKIPGGSTVAGVLAAANRDATTFETPHLFELDRDNRPAHMSFALGAHSCIGAGLARMLCRIAIEAVLDVSDFIAPSAQIKMSGWEFRGPASLPSRLCSAGEP